MTFPPDIKKLLLQRCSLVMEEKIRDARLHLAGITESVNDETKSTAGDKHETGRAMAQIEQEKAARQLAEAEKLSAALARIRSDETTSIGTGSIVVTSSGIFFISVPLGAITVSGQSFFAISIA